VAEVDRIETRRSIVSSTEERIEEEREIVDEMKTQEESNNGVPYVLRLRFGLASILHLTNQVADRVISAYDRLFSLDNGQTAKIYMGMGTDYAHDGNSEEALAALNKTLEMEPENGEAWFMVGLVHLERQDLEAAVEAFEKARNLGSNGFELHTRLAETFADMGNHKAASEELKRAVELNPDSAESFFRLGVALDNLEIYEEAARAFQKAIDLSPREPAYYQSLGFTMESLDQHQQAISYIKKAVELERRRSR
jgi:tetratricopeptide (TPR) repeat protein